MDKKREMWYKETLLLISRFFMPSDGRAGDFFLLYRSGGRGNLQETAVQKTVFILSFCT